MAESRATAKSAISALIPDNTSEEVSPEDHRDATDEIIDNAGFLNDFNQWEAINLFLSHIRLARFQSSDATETLGTTTVNVHVGSGATWTLPVTTSIGGKIYFLANLGTGLVTVQGDGSDPISGSDPYVLVPGAKKIFIWVEQYNGSVGTDTWIVW